MNKLQDKLRILSLNLKSQLKVHQSFYLQGILHANDFNFFSKKYVSKTVFNRSPSILVFT